jgi:hypothetical protein
LEIQVPKRTQGFNDYAAGTWFILHGFTAGSRESASVKLESNNGIKFAKYLTCFEEDEEFPMDDDSIEEFMWTIKRNCDDRTDYMIGNCE